MVKIPFASWIANAAVGLTDLQGDVLRQAKVVDCSPRTIYDHAHKVQAPVVGAHDRGPPPIGGSIPSIPCDRHNPHSSQNPNNSHLLKTS